MTLSALGIFSAAGAAVASGATYELIETATVSGTATTSITFASLNTYASTYKHLQIRAVARMKDSSNGRGPMRIKLNNDSSNHNGHRLYGSSSTVTSDFISSPAYVGEFPYNTATGNEYGNAVIDILDPFSTTKNKTIRSIGGQTLTSPTITFQSGLYRLTTEVSSIVIETIGLHIYAGSRFSIYGIR